MSGTNQGRKFYVCATPQPADINQAAYESLTFVEVKKIGNVGESGTTTNIVSYDTMDTEFSQKGKGISNAGDPTVEYARDYTDAGQNALRVAAKTSFIYATKTEYDDSPDGILSNTLIFNRGILTGPTRANGAVEDFILEVMTFGYVQEEIVVDPA